MPCRFAGPLPCGGRPRNLTFTSPRFSSICRWMYRRRRSTRSGSSAMSAYHDARRTQQLVADCVTLSYDRDDDSVSGRLAYWCHRHRFVQGGIEGRAECRNGADTERKELRQELIAYQFDAPKQRVRRLGAGASRGGNGPVEVVSHFEHLNNHRTPAALDLACNIAANADLDLLEFVHRPAMFGQRGLHLLLRVGQPFL